MSKKHPSILFISYDGLTDPLGQSQIIPYLAGIAARGYRIVILSCEKKQAFAKNKKHIKKELRQFGISWHPITFNRYPPLLSKMWDNYQLKTTAVGLHKIYNFDMTHCRSYVAAFVGEHLKRKFGVKMLFDMRGFWVDERIDGEIWDKEQWFYRQAYKYYKGKEKSLMKHADGIVILAKTGKKELLEYDAYQQNPVPISVIPCSANFSHFRIPTKVQKVESRRKLGLKVDDIVISYLGSVGTWYLLPEMFIFFKMMKNKYPNARFLFITPEKESYLKEQAQKYNIDSDDIRVVFAERSEVPFYLSASDVNLFFIKPCFSKKASSPVKLGEVLAMGLPVIANDKVGDVAEIIKLSNGGLVVEDLNAESYAKVIHQMDSLFNKPPLKIRKRAQVYYDLERAIALYLRLYRRILNPKKTTSKETANTDEEVKKTPAQELILEVKTENAEAIEEAKEVIKKVPAQELILEVKAENTEAIEEAKETAIQTEETTAIVLPLIEVEKQEVKTD